MRRSELEPRVVRAAIACATAFAFAVAPADAAQHRSRAEVHAFQREHPCPSTGQRRGSCPGYVIDHVHPLCAGGPDKPSNMQWQTVAEAKMKDREERRMCRKKASAGV